MSLLSEQVSKIYVERINCIFLSFFFFLLFTPKKVLDRHKRHYASGDEIVGTPFRPLQVLLSSLYNDSRVLAPFQDRRRHKSNCWARRATTSRGERFSNLHKCSFAPVGHHHIIIVELSAPYFQETCNCRFSFVSTIINHAGENAEGV